MKVRIRRKILQVHKRQEGSTIYQERSKTREWVFFSSRCVDAKTHPHGLVHIDCSSLAPLHPQEIGVRKSLLRPVFADILEIEPIRTSASTAWV